MCSYYLEFIDPSFASNRIHPASRVPGTGSLDSLVILTDF